MNNAKMVQLVCLPSILVLAITKGAFAHAKWGSPCSPIGHTYFRDSVANPGAYCLYRRCQVNAVNHGVVHPTAYSNWATWIVGSHWDPADPLRPGCPPGWVFPTPPPTPAPTPAPTPPTKGDVAMGTGKLPTPAPPPKKGDVATGTGKGDGANGPAENGPAENGPAALGTCELFGMSASNLLEEVDGTFIFDTEPSSKEEEEEEEEEEEQDASAAYTSSELNRNSCLSPDTDIPLATEEECEVAAEAVYKSPYSVHDPSWGLRPSGCYHDPASGLTHFNSAKAPADAEGKEGGVKQTSAAVAQALVICKKAPGRDRRADSKWGYCCEGKGVCRQAAGCTASRQACLDDPACAPVPRGELGPIFPFVIAPAVSPVPIKMAADDGPKNEAELLSEPVYDPGISVVADGWEGDVQERNGNCSACSCKGYKLTCSSTKCTDTRDLIAAVIKRAGITAKESKALTDTVAGLTDDALKTFLRGKDQERRPDMTALLEDSTVKSALETAGVDVDLLSGLLEHHDHDVDADVDADVDGDGGGNGEAIETDNSAGNKIPSVGDACDKDEWENTFGCPTATCVSMLPSGCEYVMNHTIINDRRDCCAALCYAEDSAGKACGDIDGGTKTASSSNVHATALAASAWLLAWLV